MEAADAKLKAAIEGRGMMDDGKRGGEDQSPDFRALISDNQPQASDGGAPAINFQQPTHNLRHAMESLDSGE